MMFTATPVSKGAQNELNLNVPVLTGGVEIGEVNGNNELCDPTNNTVYISSQYGADITKGTGRAPTCTHSRRPPPSHLARRLW